MSDLESTPSLLSMLFLGQEVRFTVDDEGVMWWVAQDVADILGIERARYTLRNFPSDEKGVCTIHTNSGERETLTVNEPGMYRLIFQSRKPEAEKMKRWVFHDLLPALRRFGSYAMADSVPAEGAHLAGAPTRESLRLPTPGARGMSLTPEGFMPPPQPRRLLPHAEISWHLLRVWVLLRDSKEALSNREISVRTGVNERTVRNHTRYLADLELVELHEMFPRHLFMIAEPPGNPAVYQRLNKFAALVKDRLAF